MAMKCRVCLAEDRFSPVVDLGHTPLADAFLTSAELELPETHYPLKVVECTRCGLVQLTYTVDRSELYSPSYPYVSNTTATGRDHYDRMAQDIAERYHITSGALAVDIGSNVGVLLDGFKKRGLRVLGVEPVPGIAQVANISGIETINDFFSEALAKLIAGHRGQAQVITGTNVIAHIDDLHDLMRGVDHLLAPDGVFVFEAPYLGDLVANMAYDTIYHEHLSYLSPDPIEYLLGMYHMEIVDIERQNIHGGTFRYYIARDCTRRPIPYSFPAIPLDSFQLAVEQHRDELRAMLHELRRADKSIVAVSAPAKGMTLLNYCGLAPYLDFVTEKAPLKVGKYTPGSHIPVLHDDALLSCQPDYALLLAWNFADEIIANLKGYRGQFIIPVPTPHILKG